MKSPSLLVCLPAYGSTVTPHTTQSLFTLAQWMTSNQIRANFLWLNMNGIEDCRNTMLTIWYDNYPDATHLLMVDADMSFPHDLIKDMLKFNQPVTGVMYAKRQMDPPAAVGVVLKEGETTADMVSGFLKVQATGAGVLLIKRMAIDAMLEKMPELIDDAIETQTAAPVLKAHGAKRYLTAFDKLKVDNGPPLSEDLAFCERWRRCGGEIWANVSHLIGHVGQFNYAIRYQDTLELQERENQEKAAA